MSQAPFPETQHARDCAYVTSDEPAPCTCAAGDLETETDTATLIGQLISTNNPLQETAAAQLLKMQKQCATLTRALSDCCVVMKTFRLADGQVYKNAQAVLGSASTTAGNGSGTDAGETSSARSASPAAPVPAINMVTQALIEAADASSKGTNTAPGLAEADMRWLFGIDQLRDFLRLAMPAPAATRAKPQQQWMPITKPGQVKVGTKLRFTIGDKQYSETAKQILHPGSEREEIIYNKRQNYYLITSMAIQNEGSQKNVEFQMAVAAPATFPAQPAQTPAGRDFDVEQAARAVESLGDHELAGRLRHAWATKNSDGTDTETAPAAVLAVTTDKPIGIRWVDSDSVR